MGVSVAQIKSDLTGMAGGASVDDIVNIYELLHRAANTMLTRVDPIETMRTTPLSQFIHDDLQNYALPSDYKKLIDLKKVEDRSSTDRTGRIGAEVFDATIGVRNKSISIESNEGTKFLRVNWKDVGAVTLHTMDSLTANGTIAVVGTASGLKANTQYKLSGSASIEFDLAASDDGIQCTGMTAVDLSDEEEYADVLIPVYISSAADLAKITSFTFIVGNDLTTNYWTFTSQTTQADGTAFRVGWNYLLFPWSTATESGSVTNTAFDAWKLTITTTGTLSNVRVDNIIVSLGRVFDIKYYSSRIFKNSAGTWLTIPTTDDDTCVFDMDTTALEIFLQECMIKIFQQSKKLRSKDYELAKVELTDLYKRYKAEYPSQSEKQVDSYWSKPYYGR